MRLIGLLTVCLVAAPSLASSPDTATWLLVANKGDSSVGIVDPSARRQIANVQEDDYTAHELAVSADGLIAFAPIYGSSGVGQPGTDGRLIDVVDVQSRKIISKIDFGHGVRPHCAVLNQADGLLYVTTELDKQVAVIDPRAFKIVGEIPTGQPESHMLGISPDGKRGYTVNVGPGTVSVLDLPARKLITVIQVLPANLQRIAISTDGKWLFTSDQVQPRLAVIDTSSNAVTTWVELPDVAYGTAVTPDGKWLLLTQPKTSKIAVLDLSSMKIAKVLDVPKNPQEIVVQPDGRKAYVSCTDVAKVAVLDLQKWSVDDSITVGKGVDGLAWDAVSSAR